jgi:hypothetical protein
MFERVCTLLLRLYPSEFRDAYGDDAAQLIRDRTGHERGVVKRARLLIDLVADLLAISLRGWHGARPMVGARNGTPHFDIIEVPGPRPEALAVGLLISTLMFASFTLLFQPRTFPPTPAELGGGSGAAPGGPEALDSAPPMVASDSDAHRELIAAIARTLRQRYFDRPVGQQLANAVLAHNNDGAYRALDGAPLAERINTHIQERSRALGVPKGTFVADVVYSEQTLPAGPPPAPKSERDEVYRQALLRQNCLFDRAEPLAQNIGYVKLDGFAHPTICRDPADRAMQSVNSAKALILDLRDNAGGFSETALHIAAYFFERPVYFYDPRSNSPVPPATASPVAGNKLADKRIFVLTSSSTQSAAEYLAYNLKMLHRATIVGETTAGRQHSGAFRRINDHFGMGIQDTAPPANPFPIKGWEVIGVEPDVTVSRSEAFEVAKRLAESSASAPVQQLFVPRTVTASSRAHSSSQGEPFGPARIASRAVLESATCRHRWRCRSKSRERSACSERLCGKTSVTARACCPRSPASAPSLSSRSRLASEPTPRSSAWSTRSCSSRCRSPSRMR